MSEISLKNIVLETDSPYLSPVPHRGLRNQSDNIKFVIKRLAEIYSETEEKIAEITTENALSVFKN